MLAAKRLARHQGVKLTKEVSQIGSSVIENARDMRVFGDRVVILDQTGFHLFDEDLNYVAMLASRKPSVTGLHFLTVDWRFSTTINCVESGT